MKILNSRILVIASLLLGVVLFGVTSNNFNSNVAVNSLMEDDTTAQDSLELAIFADDTAATDTIVSQLAFLLNDTIATDTVAFAFQEDTVVIDTIASQLFALVMDDSTIVDTVEALYFQNFAVLEDTIVADTAAMNLLFASL